VSLVSDAANAVGDGASDGVGAAGDEWDNANDALSDPGGWIDEQASDAWDSFENAGSDLFDPIADALGAPLDEIIDLDDVVGVIERAAETTPDLVVDAASEALAAIPEQYSETLSRVVEVWDDLLVDVDRMIQDIVDDVVRAGFAILPYDERAAAWHARGRARLERAGKATPFVDGQIAAIAATNELVLVTGNVRDYANFAELQLENWFGGSQPRRR